MRSLRWKKRYFEGALQKARVSDCSSFVGKFLGKKNRKLREESRQLFSCFQTIVSSLARVQ